MDPAVLLNPRGAQRRGDSMPQQQQQQHQQHSHPPTQFQQFDPRALLNPKSVSKRPAADPEADSERGHEEATFPGQISLVERLHNVQERTASPSKRVKTEEEHKKTPQSNLSGSSALDLHPSEACQASTQASSAIDLTMSDDEDTEVQVVQDNSSEIICIGKVKQVYVQSHTVPHPDPKKYSGNAGQQSRIQVKLRRAGSQKHNHIIMVADPTGKEFGKIDLRTAQGLAPLVDGAKASGLKWMVWTEPRRKQPGEGPPGTPLSTLIALTLQLYCPRKLAHTIGKYLKALGILLVDPQFERGQFDYFNPQTTASIPKHEAQQPMIQGAGQSYGQEYGGSSYAPGGFALRSVDEIRHDVRTMFDTILSAEDIPEREPTPMINKELYTHQKQALAFMLDKEQDWSGEAGDDRKDSLYKVSYRDNGQKYYRHVITGQEAKQKPPTCRGGILADEMGLGKTLSILALLADPLSLEAGNAFHQKLPARMDKQISPHPSIIQPVINSKATLLVCPLSTMLNWDQQFKEHLSHKGALKHILYHGPERKSMDMQWLAKHDLVITTYKTLSNDIDDQRLPLRKINWFRIVLDEAHAIRAANTKQSMAACRLAGQRRWAVTGTPVQNRLEDLGALFKFLRLHPFNDQQGFNTFILSPFKNAESDVITKLQLLVSSMTMRRLKADCLKDELPARHDLVVRLTFSADERKLHDWFELDSQRKVNAVTSGEKLAGNSYARILTAILHLRLICAHGRDLLNDDALKITDGMTYENPMEIEGDDDENAAASSLTRLQAYDMLRLLDQTDTDRCAYCQQIIVSGIDDDDYDEDSIDTLGYMTSCYHIVCPKHKKKLDSDWATVTPTGTDRFVTCHFCDGRVPPTAFELSRRDFREYCDEQERLKKDPKLMKKINAYAGPSTKAKALLDDLRQHKEWSNAHPEELPIKSVVFSTWTTHLDLIEIALKDHGHGYVRLDGRMSRDARQRSLTALSNDRKVQTILVSIGAGGQGLNLTAASKVYVMEPQFNPAAEAQAVDRVHRLGQEREVTIKRYIMEESFEEKMLDLQRKKKALADLTMAREKTSKEEMAKQRLEDLRSLFR